MPRGGFDIPREELEQGYEEPDCGTCMDKGWYDLSNGRCLCGCDAGELRRARCPDNSPHKHLPAHTPATI